MRFFVKGRPPTQNEANHLLRKSGVVAGHVRERGGRVRFDQYRDTVKIWHAVIRAHATKKVLADIAEFRFPTIAFDFECWTTRTDFDAPFFAMKLTVDALFGHHGDHKVRCSGWGSKNAKATPGFWVEVYDEGQLPGAIAQERHAKALGVCKQ